MSNKHGSHWFEREDFGAVTMVRLKTPQVLDETAIRDIFDPIYTLVNIGRTQLVINLAAVDYLPSLALGKLILLNRKVQAANGRLALCELSATAAEVLEKTHVSALFSIHAAEPEALASFTS